MIARVAMGQESTKQFKNPATEWLINVGLKIRVNFISLRIFSDKNPFFQTFLRKIDSPINYWTSAVPLFLPLLGKIFMATASLRGRKFPKLFKLIEDTVEDRKRKRVGD